MQPHKLATEIMLLLVVTPRDTSCLQHAQEDRVVRPDGGPPVAHGVLQELHEVGLHQVTVGTCVTLEQLRVSVAELSQC